MAARTHTAASSHAAGDLKLSIVYFSDIDNTDTYDSYISEAVAYWAVGTDDPTLTRETVAVSYTEKIASRDVGRFTFSTSEDNRQVKLYVLSKS